MQSTSLAFTRDGKTLVGAGEAGKAFIWNVATGEVAHTLDGRALPLASMALSPDGKTVALGSLWQTVQLWDVATGKKRVTDYPGHDSAIVGLAYAPDGKTLVSVGEFGSGMVWDTTTKQRTGILLGGARCVSFSSDGKQMATIGGEKDDFSTSIFWLIYNKVQIWDPAATRMIMVIEVPGAGHINSATFSPDGQKLFTLDWNRKQQNQYGIRHWDAASGKQVKLWLISQKAGYPVYLAPDGITAFLGLESGEISVNDLESGHTRLIRGEGYRWQTMKLSPDARVLATGTAGPGATVRLWEVLTGKEIFTLHGLLGTAQALAWSPDGRLLACGDRRTSFADPSVQSVRVWDAASGKEVANLGGFQSDVFSLTFSPDGTHLVAGLCDTTILVWDVSKMNPKAVRALPLGKEEFETGWTELSGRQCRQGPRGDLGAACRAKGGHVVPPEPTQACTDRGAGQNPALDRRPGQ